MADPQTTSKVSLQIMSDLHLETPRFLPMYSDFQVEPHADHLALLGDIGNVHDISLFSFIERVLHQFRIVFYILGNHEPYSSNDADDQSPATYHHACEKLKRFEADIAMRRASRGTNVSSSQTSCEEIGEFVFMNRRRWDIGHHTTILGCTLFSHVTPEQEATVSLFVSDFSNIESWAVQDHNVAHAADLAWLNQQVIDIAAVEPNRHIVILTHHCPTTQSEAHDPDHLQDDKGIQSAFATDLSTQTCWRSTNVKLWAFGHTHWNCNFVDAATRKTVIANQRGYGRDDSFNFDANLCLTLE